MRQLQGVDPESDVEEDRAGTDLETSTEESAVSEGKVDKTANPCKQLASTINNLRRRVLSHCASWWHLKITFSNQPSWRQDSAGVLCGSRRVPRLWTEGTV